MAKEIFVIYNKVTGFIEGGSGRFDKAKDVAGVGGISMRGAIKQILKENKDLKVVYLPNQSLPDEREHKIVRNKIVDLTEEDKKFFEYKEKKWELTTDILELQDEIDEIKAKIEDIRKQRGEIG